MQNFATIITPDYLPFAKVLCRSIQKYGTETKLHVLIITTEFFPNQKISDAICIYTLNSLSKNKLATDLKAKYGHSSDNFRWSLKPVFLLYLLERMNQVIYTDCDIHFFQDPSFLMNELNAHSLLLSPHWTNTDPLANQETFMMNFQAGIFNAGFIGATTKGIPVLNWWAQACHYSINFDMPKGYFVDQRYLDIIPVLDKNVKILRHKGCNIGSWNIDSCKRQMKNGKVYINNQYVIIFIHFNQETVKHILNRNDILLSPFLDEYINCLKAEGFDLLKSFPNIDANKYKETIYNLQHRLRFRTRLKRFLYRLAENL